MSLDTFPEDIVMVSLRHFIGKGKHIYFTSSFQMSSRLLESESSIPLRNNINLSPQKV